MNATELKKTAADEVPAMSTAEELAKRISFHPESVRRAIRDGRIRALTFGRFHRIPKAEVERILANGLPMPVA